MWIEKWSVRSIFDRAGVVKHFFYTSCISSWALALSLVLIFADSKLKEQYHMVNMLWADNIQKLRQESSIEVNKLLEGIEISMNSSEEKCFLKKPDSFFSDMGYTIDKSYTNIFGACSDSLDIILQTKVLWNTDTQKK